MQNASALLDEFENAALSLRASENANWVMPGVMVIREQPLNRFRNSVVTGSLSFEERQSGRFLDRVGKMRLRETSNCNGINVTQQWNYDRNGSHEEFTFVRDFEGGSFREKAVLRRVDQREASFEITREYFELAV